MNIVTVFGEGAWGTAIAQLLARNGHQVILWCYDAKVADEIGTSHTNSRYMPGITLHAGIKPVTAIAAAMEPQIIFFSTPVPFFRSVLEQVKPHYRSDQILVTLNKGIENETLLLPTQMLTAVLGAFAQTVVVAGPSFASQVIKECVTAIMVASLRTSLIDTVQVMLSNSYIRTYGTTDLMGVQVGAAVKNVIALACGMAEGAGWCANTKAFLMTRGLQEMVQLAQLFKGRIETIYDLAGVGDLILTATDVTSKNYQVGVAVGQGKPLQQILSQTGYIPEGVNSVRSVETLCVREKLQLPICHALYKSLYQNGSIKDLTAALIAH